MKVYGVMTPQVPAQTTGAWVGASCKSKRVRIMNRFEVRFQLVDSPADESEEGGVVPGESLVQVFRDFPFEDEVGRAKEGATFPTISFRRQCDGEELAVWTDDARRFDLCVRVEGRAWYANHRSIEEVEAMLRRFDRESLSVICPRSLLRRWAGALLRHLSGARPART